VAIQYLDRFASLAMTTTLLLFSSLLWAADFNVNIQGVDKSIETNIRANLILLQEADEIGLDKQRLEEE
jgi:hypothetical protein